MKSFEELGLSAGLLQAISELGFETPTPVQEEVIPFLLSAAGEDNPDGAGTAGRDLVALAQTGTGKTAAYGLPLLQQLDSSSPVPRVLVLSPTRELCIQIAEDLGDFSKHSPGVRILPVYGGASIRNQIEALEKGVHIIVATPGRLLDLMRRGKVDLAGVNSVVMDEADEMLNMGFSEDIDAILADVPFDRRTLLFSATMPAEVARISKSYMKDPREIVIGKRNEGTSSVRHICYMVQARDKYRTLKRIIDYCPRIYGIIFCRTKLETQEISEKLIKDGYNVDALHGDLSQQVRDNVMQRFRLRNIRLLVATDVAARGLDVDDLTHVINYTLPDEDEVYTHRSGRTGRAGKTGISIAIINLKEQRRIRNIEKGLGKTFEMGKIPSGKDICSKQIFTLVDRLENTEVREEEIADILPAVLHRLEWLDRDELVKRLVSMEFDRLISYYREDLDFEALDHAGKKEEGGKKRPAAAPCAAGYTKVFLSMGKADGIGPKNVLGMLNDCVGGRIDVGHIELGKRHTVFEVDSTMVQKVIDELSTLRYKGRIVRVSIDKKNQ